MQYEVIIPAAGTGKRMGASHNKMLLELFGKTIVERTVQVFADDPHCDKVILVVHPDDELIMKELLSSFGEKVIFVHGGSERQYSVASGLQAISVDCEVVLVHDGARPFIRLAHIAALVQAASEHVGGAVLAVRVKDTMKIVESSVIRHSIDRDKLWAMQTPQAFRVNVLREAHRQAKVRHFLGTDEASLVEELGHSVRVVTGSYDNIKITTVEDLLFAEAILKRGDRNVSDWTRI